MLLAAPALGQSASGGGGLASVSDDTSPELGGDLNVAGRLIKSSSENSSIEVGAGIEFQSSGGDVMSGSYDGESTTKAKCQAGQSAACFIVEESGGDQLWMTHTGAQARLVNSSGDMYLWTTRLRIGPDPASTGYLALMRCTVCTSDDFEMTNSLSEASLYRDAGDLKLDVDSGETVYVEIGDTTRLVVTSTYVEFFGCRHYGPLASPPPNPNGACDRYYDASGSECIYDGAAWDVSSGSGSCS